MQQRIWTPGVIDRRTTDRLETQALIEACPGCVLLVDVDRQHRMQRHRMLDEHPADATAARIGVDEQRVDLRPIHAHEGERLIVFISGSPELGGGQLLVAHQSLNGSEVFRRQEVVRGDHGGTPDREGARKIVRTGGANGNGHATITLKYEAPMGLQRSGSRQSSAQDARW